jgi:hypothetical protein
MKQSSSTLHTDAENRSRALGNSPRITQIYHEVGMRNANVKSIRHIRKQVHVLNKLSRQFWQILNKLDWRRNVFVATKTFIFHLVTIYQNFSFPFIAWLSQQVSMVRTWALSWNRKGQWDEKSITIIRIAYVL